MISSSSYIRIRLSFQFLIDDKMPIDMYYLPPSIPCRSVMMLAKALGIHLNLKIVNIMEGEHLKPEFLRVSLNKKKKKNHYD